MLGTTKHCYILNMYAVGLVVSEKKIFKFFFFFFSIISLWELMTPQGMASLDPWGMTGKLCYILNT